jgi:hypothetical protein
MEAVNMPITPIDMQAEWDLSINKSLDVSEWQWAVFQVTSMGSVRCDLPLAPPHATSAGLGHIRKRVE